MSNTDRLLSVPIQLTLRRIDPNGQHSDTDVECSGIDGASMSDLVTAARTDGLIDAHPGETFFSDGQPVLGSTPIGGLGLRSGSVVSYGSRGPRTSQLSSVLTLHVISGPDAGAVCSLALGDYVIGRTKDSDLAIDDPDLSRCHFRLQVTARGVWVIDLDSTNGTLLDRASVGSEPMAVAGGAEIRAGNTVLVVRARDEPPAATHPLPSGFVQVNRAPRFPSTTPLAALAFPDTPSQPARPRLNILAAVLPLLLAVALALAMHSAQLLAFGLLTPLSMMAGAGSERWSWRRQARQSRSQYRLSNAAAEIALQMRLSTERERRNQDSPDPAMIRQVVTIPTCQLWERRLGTAEFLSVRVGRADTAASTQATRDGRPIAGLLVRDVPITVDLKQGPAAVVGPSEVARGVSRWTLGQLAALHSANDFSIIALLSSADECWRWLRWLDAVKCIAVTRAEQQAAVNDLLAEMSFRAREPAAQSGVWTSAWTVVLIDQGRTATTDPGLAELLANGPRVGITAVLIDEDRRLLPRDCTTLIEVGGDLGAHASVSTKADAPLRNVELERVGLEWADTVARALSPLRDADNASDIPSQVRLPAVARPGALSADQLCRSWKRRPVFAATIGEDARGPVVIDLVRDGPHALIAGTTGAGKSEFLRTLIAALALEVGPDQLAFVLIDYKGGAAFAECVDLPHTVGLVTDLDAHLTARALTSLEAEIRRREKAFAELGIADWADLPAARVPHDTNLPRLVLVVDEFAALAEELPNFLSGLLSIAQRGRSLGVHLVLATQRPAGVVSADIKANMALRVALRVTDPAESLDILDVDSAARIKKSTPGRAIARVSDDRVLFQTAFVGHVEQGKHDRLAVRPLDQWNRRVLHAASRAAGPTDLHAICAALREAANEQPSNEQSNPDRRWRSPWLAPLPSRVEPARLGRQPEGQIAFGLIDQPRHQSQVCAVHDLRRGGSLAFIGGSRSGRSTAIYTIVTESAACLSAADLEISVLDCAGGTLSLLAGLPHCVGVLDCSEPATIERLLSRLTDHIRDHRRPPATSSGAANSSAIETEPNHRAVLLALDGWENFVALSEQYDGGASLERLVQIVREGPSAGVSVVLAGDRGLLGLRISSAINRKFVLRLNERSDYAAAGIASASIPAASGPGRAVEASTGDEVQLATSTQAEGDRLHLIAAIAERCDVPSDRLPVALRPLPSKVDLCDIAASSTSLPGRVVIGVGGDSATPVEVDLADGDGRFLICGPRRSGRTTALLAIAEQLLQHRSGLIIAATKRSTLSEFAKRHGLEVLHPDSDASAAINRTSSPATVLVDDAEQFTDTPVGDLLSGIISDLAADSLVVASCRNDDLLISFRGIAAEVRRSRTGLLLQPSCADGEALGLHLSRRPASPIPGRGILVIDQYRDQAANGLPIQVAYVS